MIKEAYCSFKVAKLLKEKGFDKPCRSYFIDNVDYIDSSYSTEELTDLQMGVWEILRPTHQMACAWLREIHNKHCDIGYDIDLKWFFQIIDLKETVEYDYHEMKIYHAENSTGFNSYEEATEAAIKYTLENLL